MRARAVVATVVMAVALAACGGTGGGNETTSRPARSGPGATVSVESYVESVCTSMDDMLRALTSRVTQLAGAVPPEADLAQVQQILTATFQEVDTAFVELERDVAAAGIPDVEEGLEFTQVVQTNLERARTAFRRAGERFVASLDDVSDLDAAARTFGQEVLELSRGLGEAFPDEYPEIDAASQRSPTCRQIGADALPAA